VPAPEQIYTGSVRALSVLMIALGAAILVSTIIAGGGPLSIGVLIGIAFLGVGAGRLFIARRAAK
jgi:hypothetical protein